jgi:hypothetical protein
MEWETFDKLKKALWEAPTLALLDFHKMFVLKTDARGIRLGAILSQDGRLVAFFSKALGP